MKYSIIFCFAAIFLFPNLGFSQNDDFSKNQLKFYFNTINEGYTETRVSSNDRVLKSISKVGVPSIAYAWQTGEKKWQEVEVSAFFDNNRDISVTGNAMISNFAERLGYISARYERNRILLTSDRVDLSLGGSFQAFYLHNSFAPMTSADFPFSYNGLHTRLSIIPRALIKFERFALDFNMPYSVMSFNVTSFREENQTIVSAERTNSGLQYDLFPNSYFLQARVGIVVDLN